jgi:indole-3-glycerol phosphate synthase
VSRLENILTDKRREVEALHGRAPVGGATRTPIDVVQALRRGDGDPLRLVAEVKLRSPSAGRLSHAMAPGDRALAYAQAGAAMVSVLCDERYFGGSWEHLKAARQRLDDAGGSIPLLAKEFVIDERQITEARDCGADAVLLIARIVDASHLSRLARAARSERLEPLIEVVDERELESALDAKARVVGVNARDLDTLAMDGARAARVCSAIPPDVVAVYFSGVRQAGDVAQIARSRADAALVGEVLMRDDDPRPRLRALVEAARGA